LDLMEVLYRCLRGAKTPPPDKFLPQPQVRALFHSALTKTKTVDLAKELRACLLELNNTVPNPSVQSFKALSIQFSAPEVVRAHEPWLDVGNRQLTINVIIIDQETSPDDPPSPEPLDFDFDNIREATVQDGEGADAQGVCIVTLQLDKLPSVLQQEHSRLDTLSMVLRAEKAVAAPLLRRLKGGSTQLNVASQDEIFFELTQAPRKAAKMS
ncbi:hypothetical protein HaLaN_01519, partial [Haematococcus lacustris]